MTSEKEIETGPRTRDPRMWATIKSDGDPIGRLQKLVVATDSGKPASLACATVIARERWRR